MRFIKQQKIRKLGYVISVMILVFIGKTYAQSYPNNKIINLIIPFAQGGASDILGNKIAQGLEQELNTVINVVNMRGGSGSLGLTHIKNSKADGLTLGIASSSAIFSNPAFNNKIEYSPTVDFAYIGVISKVPRILIVSNNLGVNNFQEFVDLVKAEDKLRKYASAGYGSDGHLMMEQLNYLVGIKLKHKAYTGDGAAIKALESGKVVDVALVNLLLAQTTPIMQSIIDGKVKALAVTSDVRLSQLPNVPTFGELNLKQLNRSSIYSLLVPADTPKNIINTLQQTLNKVLQNNNNQVFFTQNETQDVNKIVADEYNFYKSIVINRNLKPEE